MHLLLLVHLGLASFPLIYCIEFLCPSTSQWFKRAKTACNFADQYYCLYDDNNRKYTEICQETPTFDSAGHKVVIVGGIQGVDCEHDIYQPFKYWTNGSSTCAFKKNLCNAEGQVIHDNGTTKTDRQCRCDYSRGYDFIKKPKYDCYCEPSKEDCSCFQKHCPSGLLLTPDYKCIDSSNWNMKFMCSMLAEGISNGEKDRNAQFVVDIFLKADKTDNSNLIPRVVITICILLAMVVAVMVVLIAMDSNPCFWNLNVKDERHQEQEIPVHIRELQCELKQQWRQQFNHFVETERFSAILKRLENESFIIVSGPPGCGKTSSMFHLALNLEKIEGFELFILSNSEDIMKYSSKNIKRLFLLDDVFGKYFTNDYNTKWWGRHGKDIQNLLAVNPNLKLIMTSRSYIIESLNLEQTKVPLCELNLCSEHLLLTKNEKEQIAKSYLPEGAWKKLNDEDVMLFSFFPSLCAGFKKEEVKDCSKYFSTPFDYIAVELEHFQETKNLFYLALTVLVIRGNKVNKNIFTKTNTKNEHMFNDLSKDMGLGKEKLKSYLSSHFVALKDSYIAEQELEFECVDKNLFNILAHCIGPKILRAILLYGRGAFIVDRMQLELSSGPSAELIIVVPMEFEIMLFDKLLNDVQSGKLRNILTGYQHTILKFRQSFLSYMRDNLRKKMLKNDKADSASALHIVSEEGIVEYVSFFLDLNPQMINQKDKYGDTPLHKACINGHQKVAELLLENGANVNVTNNNGKTVVDIANQKDSSMVDILFQR